jgi:hypothetical protein
MAVYAVLSFSASIEESGSLAINAAPAVAATVDDANTASFATLAAEG